MNGFYNGYDSVIIETPEEREKKRRGQKKLFSRVFLALFLYLIVSQFLSVGIYTVASVILSKEQYIAFAESSVWSVVISCAVQYVIAFPIFLLALIGTDKAAKKERSKLSLKEFILLFLVGQVLMYAGNFIGTMLNQTIGSILGDVPENGIATIINETPIWLIFVLMVIVAPIVEELICRKLIIDRLSIYGDHIAILFSAVGFGLLHGNLYQFFYAVLLGGLIGYVYTKTRDVKYTIYMHMIINFMGSIVALPVQKALTDFYEMYDLAMLGEQFDFVSFILNAAIMLIYSNLQYGMIAGGIFAIIHLYKNKQIKLQRDKEIFLPDKEIIKGGIANVGAILFISLCVIFMGLNLFA